MKTIEKIERKHSKMLEGLKTKFDDIAVDETGGITLHDRYTDKYKFYGSVETSYRAHFGNYSK